MTWYRENVYYGDPDPNLEMWVLNRGEVLQALSESTIFPHQMEVVKIGLGYLNGARPQPPRLNYQTVELLAIPFVVALIGKPTLNRFRDVSFVAGLARDVFPHQNTGCVHDLSGRGWSPGNCAYRATRTVYVRMYYP